MFGLRLPVVYHTKESMLREDLNMDVGEESFTVRDIILYDISGIAPDLNEEGELNDFTIVYSCGEIFTCVLPLEQVHNKIVEAKKNGLL